VFFGGFHEEEKPGELAKKHKNVLCFEEFFLFERQPHLNKLLNIGKPLFLNFTVRFHVNILLQDWDRVASGVICKIRGHAPKADELPHPPQMTPTLYFLDPQKGQVGGHVRKLKKNSSHFESFFPCP